MKTSEVINRAADLIEEHGWIQGAWGLAYNGEPILPLCAEGAILAASGRGAEWWDARRMDSPVDPYAILNACPATRAVRDYLEWPEPSVLSEWNDAEERTAEEVIAVLRAAAVVEAAKENAETRESVTA